MQDALNTRSVVACRVASSDERFPVEFGCAADSVGARRWMRTFRRIDRVEFERQGNSWRCTVRGIGHRLPLRQAAPLRIGIGLAELGLPALLLQRHDRNEVR